MRARLATILFVPVLALLLTLGLLYVASLARASQQEVVLDRLRDVSYLSELALQSLEGGDPDLVTADLERYSAVYGIGAAVLDQSGAVWASNGLEVDSLPERDLALAGRRSEPADSFLPWEVNHIVVAEPLFSGGDLVGAVITESDVDYLSRNIWRNWGLLALTTILMSGFALVIADRTAMWVLGPVRAVEKAMAAIGQGQLAARIPTSTGPPELGAVIARFNNMAEEVERLMRRQQEFVSNASHELRNPLNALILRVEDLDLSLPPEQSAEVASVRSEAFRMAHILDALLLLARDTKPEVDHEPVDVEMVVAGRVASWGQLASERTLVLEPSGEDLVAAVNRDVLESALDTVLDNALKFTPDGSTVEVSMRLHGDMVLVEVRDHGPGVPPEEIDRIVERFWRSPGHGAIRGSGLGLAICSELLELGGGDLSLSLPEDGGLRVGMSVPRWQGAT